MRSLKIQRIGIKCKTLLGIVVNHNFIEIGYIIGLGSQMRIYIGNNYDTVQLGSIVAIHTEYGIDPLVGIELFGRRGYKLHGCSRLIGPIVTFPESHESYPARYRFVHQHVNVLRCRRQLYRSGQIDAGTIQMAAISRTLEGQHLSRTVYIVGVRIVYNGNLTGEFPRVEG